MTKKPLKPQAPSSVVIIGLGGVGSIVARYGCVFLASLKKPVTVILVDGDKFEPSNATRMLFNSFDNKAKATLEELRPRLKDSRLLMASWETYVNRRNLKHLVKEGDLCLLCVDNHATRRLVSRHCAKLKDVCLISGGNDGITEGRRGTYGNVQVYLRRKDKNLTHSLEQYHPEIAQPQDKLPTDLHCTELIASTPQILFANLAVASTMLNTMLLVLANQLHYGEISFDIAAGLMRPTLKLP